MAWNEPGNGNNRDPWNNKGGDQGPPDLDEVVRKLQDKMGGLFGGKRGGSGGGNDDDNGGSNAGSGSILALVLVALVLYAGYDSFYTVQAAERGVIQRFGAYHSITGPGPHLKLPWVDSVTPINVDQLKKFSHRAQMLTKDENIVDVTVEVQFRILDAADYMFQDSDPDKTIYGAMESALREVIGKSVLDDIIAQNRSGIALAVQKSTQQLLDLYRTGLTVASINIQGAKAPEPVQDAFDDAIKAREDKERLQNQAQTYANDVVPRARGEAARVVEDAKAYKAKVVAEAEGESQRFLALLGEYQKAPGVTRERLYLETMQEVLKKTGKVVLDVPEGGNNLTYLPLDRIMQQAPVAPRAGGSAVTPQSHVAAPPVNQNRRGRNGLSRDRGGR